MRWMVYLTYRGAIADFPATNEVPRRNARAMEENMITNMIPINLTVTKTLRARVRMCLYEMDPLYVEIAFRV